MLHWLAHLAGLDTQNGIPYMFWSGIGTQVTVLVAAYGAYHKHRCHWTRCLRIGKHVVRGTPYCLRHRPADARAPESCGCSRRGH